MTDAVQTASEIVFILDRAQVHTHVYGSWIEREGLSQSFFLGKTAREILGPDAAEVHEVANRRALAGEDVLYEWSLEAPNGTRCFRTSLSPVRDPGGAITGIVGVGRETPWPEVQFTDRMQHSRITPICMHCSKVRDDEDTWQSLESYFAQRLGIRFSHSLCPACFETHYAAEISPRSDR